MSENQDIERFFRESFENFEVTPPDEVKQGIDARLTFGKQPTGSKRRRFGFWFGMLILSGGTLFFFLQKQTTPSARQHAAVQHTGTQQEKQHLTDEATVAMPQQQADGASPTSTANPGAPALAARTAPADANKVTNQNVQHNKDVNTSSVNAAKKQKSAIRKKKGGVRHHTGSWNPSGAKNKKSTPSNVSAFSADPKQSGFDQSLVATNSNAKEHVSTTVDTLAAIPNKTNDQAKSSATDPDKKPENQNSSAVANNSNPDAAKTAETDPPKDAANKLPLMLSLKMGPSLALNQLSGEKGNDIKEKTGFETQLEASYLLKNKFSFSSGVNYFQSMNTLSQESTITDSSLSFAFYDYLLKDTFDLYQNDSVIDTIFYTIVVDSIPVYGTFYYNHTLTKMSSFHMQTFSIPLLFGYSFAFGQHLNLDVMAGGMLQFTQLRFTDASEPLNQEVRFTKTTFSPVLKTHLRYQFEHWGVSLSTNMGYHPGSPTLSGMTRQRYSFGFGAGLHYRF